MFSNCHSPTQDLIALALLDHAVLLKTSPKNKCEALCIYYILEMNLGTTDVLNFVHKLIVFHLYSYDQDLKMSDCH